MNIIKQAPNGSKDILTVAPNRPVIDYLYDYDDLKDMETDIYVNNKKLERDEEFNYIMREGDLLRIVYRPSGVEVAVIAAVTAVLVLLAVSQTEDYTNSAGETSTSSNNSVSGQSNTVRKYEGIPSICGRVWSYPDLIANAIPEWVSNRKQVRELFLVSEGELQINGVRDSTTDIDDIAESSYTVYGPNTYPSDLYRIQFNDSVNGEELIAPDSASVVWEGEATYSDTEFGVNISGLTDGYSQIIFSDSSSAVIYDYKFTEYDNNVEIEGIIPSAGEIIQFFNGDTVTTINAGTYTIESVSVSSGNLTLTFLESTTYEVITYNDTVGFRNPEALMIRAAIGGDGLYVNDLGISSGDYITTGEWGEFLVGGVTTSRLYLEYGEPVNSTGVVTTNTTIYRNRDIAINVIGPYTMPTTAEQIWFNAAATNGLQSNSGGKISVSVTFYAQQINVNGDDVGSPISQQITFTGNSGSTIGQTVKMTGLGGERYKVYAIRDTNTFSGNAIQDVFWQEAFTVNSYDGSNFGDVTVIDVVTKASTSGTSSSRKINLDVTRKIGGVATTNFADYVVHFITEKGGYSLDYINTGELYEIADSLSDDLKEFSYTFDDADLTLAQIVQSICDVARVTCYRDGQQWRFTRDEAKPRTYMFNRRNLASGDNQAITLSTRQPQDYDGISLRYYNRDTEDYDNIYIKIDFDTQSFIVGEFGDNLKEIDLAGCANYAQALNRAHLEARKIVYQRKGVEDTALMDASNVSIGERVSWCDIFDGDIFDGEITGQDGTTYYTSEPFRPESGVTYYALITDEDDQPMATVEVTENPEDEKSFIATLTDAVLIADNYSIQLGSRYIIGSVDDIDDTDYTVMGRGGDSGNGLISLELVQYSDNIYEMD